MEIATAANKMHNQWRVQCKFVVLVFQITFRFVGQ